MKKIRSPPPYNGYSFITILGGYYDPTNSQR